MKEAIDWVELGSPAKVNLTLSVHGRRPDGFHALTSLVAALDFGDTLRVQRSSCGADHLRCSDPAVPTGTSNLVLKAAQRFRERLGSELYFEFDLEKRIPMGAGLGGGSSNASAALLAMNALAGHQLDRAQLLDLAAMLGSDCPFFIDSQPSIMRGRGEVIEPLGAQVADSLRGVRIALFKSHFSVETAWAYAQLIAGSPQSYQMESIAQFKLRDLSKLKFQLPDLLYNSFEAAVGKKYVALPTLLETLRAHGVPCLMSGSGSCCFALLDSTRISPPQIKELCQDAWGESIFWIETKIS